MRNLGITELCTAWGTGPKAGIEPASLIRLHCICVALMVAPRWSKYNNKNNGQFPCPLVPGDGTPFSSQITLRETPRRALLVTKPFPRAVPVHSGRHISSISRPERLQAGSRNIHLWPAGLCPSSHTPCITQMCCCGGRRALASDSVTHLSWAPGRRSRAKSSSAAHALGENTGAGERSETRTGRRLGCCQVFYHSNGHLEPWETQSQLGSCQAVVSPRG